MSSEGRRLTEEEFDEIVVVLRKELEKRLKFLSDDRIVGNNDCLSRRIFDLEFCIVSPLYYRLQRHLIDWGTRSHHSELSDLKLARWLDEQGYKYDDTIPLQYHKTKE